MKLHKSYTFFSTPLKPICYKGLKFGYYWVGGNDIFINYWFYWINYKKSYNKLTTSQESVLITTTKPKKCWIIQLWIYSKYNMHSVAIRKIISSMYEAAFMGI